VNGKIPAKSQRAAASSHEELNARGIAGFNAAEIQFESAFAREMSDQCVTRCRDIVKVQITGQLNGVGFVEDCYLEFHVS